MPIPDFKGGTREARVFGWGANRLTPYVDLYEARTLELLKKNDVNELVEHDYCDDAVMLLLAEDEPMVISGKDELKKHKLSDTEELFDPETGESLGQIFTGEQYVLKLDHQAEKKMSARAGGLGYGYRPTGEAVSGSGIGKDKSCKSDGCL